MTKIRKPNAATESVAEEWLRRHLCYEVGMMRQLLPVLAHSPPSQFERNIHIECFHLHARNLIEFFKNKDPCDIDPRRFTKPSYQPDGNFIDKDLEARINQQISHLTSNRVGAKQLGPSDWRKISATIEAEIARFEKHLTKDAEGHWRLGLSDMGL
ncbi:hypothetical protein AB8Z38_07290 [Bradyrhizobium sp. LLZ17]|uniref:HEPN AbiU2-like domain-containing protein n=1 Tax=Bradyrhizobium sp. LLZ17 TaxID=3239388 RepID=A0AB39XMN8_9BRAD